MDVGVYPYSHGDPLLIDKIVNEFLSQGKFDKLRKECMSDADTKPAYQNLQQRVESTVTQFLKKQVWRPDLNKNQLRDSLRKHILESGFFDAGINRIVDQVVNPNVLATVFMPEVEEVVYSYLSIPRPADKYQKRGFVSNGEDKKPLRGEEDYKSGQENGKYEKKGMERTYSGGCQPMDTTEDRKPKDCTDGTQKDKDSECSTETVRVEMPAEEKTKKSESSQKPEDKIKSEPEEATKEETSEEPLTKMEVPSDESEESLSRMGVERLQITEPDVPVPDSDDSMPLEINEKSMSESRDSEDSIMNQMSPISQGRLTPDIEPPKPEKEEEKKPLTFIGRIPKIKREDSESSKSSKADPPKREKLEVKNVYSSDESDSSKSYGKSDSDERKSKEKRKLEEMAQKDDKRRDERKKRDERTPDEHHKSSKDRRSHDRSKDRKRDKSRDRHGSKKSSSSSSRERSSSRHKSSHQTRHKDSKSRDHDRKRKEEEKKKSKSADDHGKERNKKEDRRSTDRDSNERERDRAAGGRTQGESRRREKEDKPAESREEKTQKEEAEAEAEAAPESGEVVIEMEEKLVSEGGVVLVNEDWVSVVADDTHSELDFNELHENGVLTMVDFPKLTDDFYVKFNSTGFKYFEEWEKNKLDCEEEFKEFVDEADSNINLISDDDSDVDTRSFQEENRKTIGNLLRGLGNFRKSLMFSPHSGAFFRWTNNKFYQKYRKGGRRTEKNESDDSIKENIDRETSGLLRTPGGEKENQRRLHLKLLNRYRRKAMRQGKPRRRQRRGRDGGIKEKNDNRSASARLVANYPPEVMFRSAVSESDAWRMSAFATNYNLVEAGENRPEAAPGRTSATVTSLPDSPEDNSSSDWPGQKGKVKVEPARPDAADTRCGLPLHLPPSPDSDDVHSKNDTITNRKRLNKTQRGGTPKKQSRRNYCQKYDSQDLYKPRPLLNGSRTRGRGVEPDGLGSPVSTSVYNVRK